MGAASGAWFGLLIGLFFSIFARGFPLALPLWGLIWGAIAGAIFGLIAHALSGGKRDFLSSSSLVADRYEVLVTAEHSAEARKTARRRHASDAAGELRQSGRPRVTGDLA